MRLRLTIFVVLFLLGLSVIYSTAGEINVGVIIDFVNTSTNTYYGRVGGCPQAEITSRDATFGPFDLVVGPLSTVHIDTELVGAGEGLHDGDSIEVFAGTIGNVVLIGQYTYDSGQADGAGRMWVSGANKVFHVDGSDCTTTSGNEDKCDIPWSYTSTDSVRRGLKIHFSDGTVDGTYSINPGETLHDSSFLLCGTTVTSYELVAAPFLGEVEDTSPVTNSDGTVSQNTNGPSMVQTNGSVTYDTNPPVVTTDSGSASTNSGSLPTPSQYNPSQISSPIIWSSAAGTNPILTTQQGDSALYDAITKGISQAHSDAFVIDTNISGVGADIKSLQTSDMAGLNGISNLLAHGAGGTSTNIYGGGSSNVWVQNWPTNGFGSGNSTNELTLTNYASETTLEGISNLLSATNSQSISIPNSATNGDAAVAAATSAEGDQSGISGFLSSLTPNLPSDGPSSAPDMTMTFCGETINLDPFVQFPGLSSFALTGFRIVLILAFLVELGHMFWELVKAKSSTQTGGVPDLEVMGFTFGGNILGAITAVIIPAVFIGIFVLVMAYVFAHLGVDISQALDISGWLNGMGATAEYLLTSLFPVSLFFSLVFTRITLQFTLAKMFSLASDASRFLWGK